MAFWIPFLSRKGFDDDFPLKNYTRSDFLGQGTFGEVRKYSKRHFQLGGFGLPDEVAVKSLKGKLTAAEREISVVRRCDHPNIIKTFGSCQVYGKPCLVLELCSKDLSKALEEQGGKLPLEKCRQILTQLSSGLEYLREQGIVHRDLKPQNILFRKTGPPN